MSALHAESPCWLGSAGRLSGAAHATRGPTTLANRLRTAVKDCMFCHAMSTPEQEIEYTIERPNRDKAASKATKAVVILLLLISAGLVFIVTAGGWDRLAGAKAVQIFYIIVYLVMAYYVAR